MKKTFISLIILVFLLSIKFNAVSAAETPVLQSEYEESFYINIDSVHPGQIRYSDYVVKKKMEENIQNGEVYWDDENQTRMLKYFDNTSLFPLSKALPVVKALYGFVLVDGHHHYLTNLAFNGSFIPIKVIADFSNLSYEDFLGFSEEHGLIHPYDIYGNRVNLPTSFHELENDSNRLFASLCKRRYTDVSDIDNSKGSEYPIWIKIGKDIPFIEMRISEALWNSGAVYDDQQGFEPDIEFYEHARKLINLAEIDGLRVIPTRTYYKDINWVAI